MTTEILHKVFRPEIKGVDENEGTIDMLIPMSTASIDRDGESIDPLGWKKSLPAFRKRPVLLSSHDYGDLRKQIGEFKSIKLSEDGLLAKPHYYINEGNEEADWAFKLASKGMAAYSVGFIPIKWEDGTGDKEPRRTYTEQELLEISHVVVPSNRDAIQGLRGKSADPMINQLVEDIVNAEIVDLAEEKEVIEEHPKPKEYSQQEIEDEIDFVKLLISENGMSDATKSMAWELVREIMRLNGNDIPSDLYALIKPKQTKEDIDKAIQRILDQTVKNVVKNS